MGCGEGIAGERPVLVHAEMKERNSIFQFDRKQKPGKTALGLELSVWKISQVEDQNY